MTKKYILSGFLICEAFLWCNAQCVFDNFNTDYGNWTSYETYINSSAGVTGMGVGFNTRDDHITTQNPINNPNSITFYLGRSSSASNRTLSIQYSTSLSGSWTTAESITVDAVSEAHTLFSVNLNLEGMYYLRIIMSERSAGSYYLDDVTVYCSASNAPELQLIDENNTLQNCGYTLHFDDILTSETAEKTITLKNTGDVDLDISDIQISEPFSISNVTAPIQIAPDEAQLLRIRFSSDSAGAFNNIISIINSDADEGMCQIQLSGTAIAPSPEIDVERNTENSIPSGANASIGYNTIFASTAINETSQPKTYYIHNEGTADLTIGTINSSNATEFKLINTPSNQIIPPNTKITFDIEFSPQTSGTRSSVISITNNDADENPYTFSVEGTGTCVATLPNIMPDTGPPGTVITITSANFGNETTADINGISANVNVITDTQIEVTLPENATSGNLNITNNLGCSMSTNFDVISRNSTACKGDNGNTPTQLFISEITDHPTGSHSYIEIYNGTGTPINLEDYTVEIIYNGEDTTRTLALDGSLNHQDTYLIAFGATDANQEHATVTAQHISNAVGINNNDHIRLLYQGEPIDVWGDATGNTFTVSDRGYTYRRKNTLSNLPSTSWQANDWYAFKTVDYTDIGIYDFSVGIPPNITLQTETTPSSCKLTDTFIVTANEGVTDATSLNYQWYENLKHSNTWNIIHDNDNYQGTQTSSLHILNTALVDGNQYYCRVLEDNNLCYTASKSIAIDLKTSEWHDGNWVNSEADESAITILNSNFNTQTHGNLNCCSLYIPEDVTLTINAEHYTKIHHNLIVEGTLIVKNKGSFVQENDTTTPTNNGTILVEKETAILNAWYEYTYWSTPVVNETFANAFNNSKRLFWFDASRFADLYKEENNDNTQTLGQDDVDDNGDDWQPIATGETITKTDYLQAGVGYAATHTDNNFTAGMHYTYSFSGNFNNGIIHTPVTRNDESTDDNNWNLIGNPYPSAISADAFFNANVYSAATPNQPLEGVIYLWSQDTPPSKSFNGNDVYNFSPSDYAIINGTGTVAAQEGSGQKPNRFIPSCQGFFVKFSDAFHTNTATVLFNNQMRVTSENTQFFKSEVTPKIWINLTSDNAIFSQTLIGYLPNATDTYDGSYFDVNTIINDTHYAKLYTTIPNTDVKLVIQGKSKSSLSQDENIALGFYNAIETPTIFSLDIDDFEGNFFEQNPIYLKDHFTNTYHDLKQGAYKFISDRGDFPSRFEIVFKTATLGVNDLKSDNFLEIIQIDTQQTYFKLHSDALQIKQITIFDTLGRTLSTFNQIQQKPIFNLSSLQSIPIIAAVTLTNGNVIHKKLLLR
ncbi:choice-of-anchor D domain-containing protein [Formosa sp. A9]|uniref:choice-of-anchor D domain-containing protein n=1 Tax=Formosa sp. A9 TaxID=3442641 RepID=UPI003EC0C145